MIHSYLAGCVNIFQSRKLTQWLHSFTSLKCKRRKNLNERRMLIRWCSPRAFVAFFFFTAFKPAHCAGWVSSFFLLIHQKQVTHGTQSMGFEAIHQPKSRCVLFPCNSVANSSTSASAWSFFRGKCFCLCLRYPQN